MSTPTLSPPPAPPEPRPRRWFRRAGVVLLALAVAPLLRDSTALCVANWQGVAGHRIPYVETPALDLLATCRARVSKATATTTGRLFRSMPAWDRSTIIAVTLAASTLTCLLLLRRGNH